uniref:Secreted protein n=1 Tax=Setaria viridis TaxID=4556 RepID=A0A4U6T3Q2_SETVI|nr:hypothetical protein SEVIR_9G305350v2 [Setaria viridis]
MPSRARGCSLRWFFLSGFLSLVLVLKDAIDVCLCSIDGQRDRSLSLPPQEVLKFCLVEMLVFQLKSLS